MYQSEFCEISYFDKENFIVIEWKKFCRGEDYREPLRYALSMLEKYKGCNVIADARNGFEDEKEDIDWAVNEFIPQMAKTDCKKMVFVVNEVNEIKGEIDFFTGEFQKYFKVKSVTSMEEAFEEFQNLSEQSKVLNVTYMVKPGTREEFYQKVKEARIPELSRAEEGNIKYEYFIPVEHQNQILLIEIWKGQASVDEHMMTEHFSRLQAIKADYVVDVKLERFIVSM